MNIKSGKQIAALCHKKENYHNGDGGGKAVLKLMKNNSIYSDDIMNDHIYKISQRYNEFFFLS